MGDKKITLRCWAARSPSEKPAHVWRLAEAKPGGVSFFSHLRSTLGGEVPERGVSHDQDPAYDGEGDTGARRPAETRKGDVGRRIQLVDEHTEGDDAAEGNHSQDDVDGDRVDILVGESHHTHDDDDNGGKENRQDQEPLHSANLVADGAVRDGTARAAAGTAVNRAIRVDGVAVRRRRIASAIPERSGLECRAKRAASMPAQQHPTNHQTHECFLKPGRNTTKSAVPVTHLRRAARGHTQESR